ncbi:MAG: M20 aminoacylase family protein [Cardiobacteriaceae bacterium]|nr:M20 aminoacylase family protein [Cardiobacteriaceae bacterium]
MTPAITAHDPIDTLMRAWRHDFHQHPETAFEETRTSAKVAELLQSFALDEVHTGLAVTGVVGVLHGEKPGPRIALRADMDALDIHETNTFAHRSTTPGKMHACGHDGHTSMLLGAAKYLSEHRDFPGTAIFIFQPAEENEVGGRRMCDEGLFEQFPADAVYGLHNWPELPAGTAAVHDREVMASFDIFDIDIHGKGCHGAMPHLGIDAVAIAAQIVSALQLIVSRNVDSAERAVVSVTQIHGGDMYNILPASVRLSGGTRALDPAVRDLLETRIRETASGIAEALGASASVHYQRRYPPTINHPAQAETIHRAACALLGNDNVQRNPPPSMAAEDFAVMLERRPGAYIWLGNGKPHPGAVLHSPGYDFNDDILALGASLWVALIQQG